MKETNKEYAKALFMLASEANSTDDYAKHLAQIRCIMEENPAYTEFLGSPAIPLSERMAAIDAAFEKAMPEHLVSFLKLLCENGRIHTLAGCIDAFDDLVNLESNSVVATVYSAIPLSDAQKAALCKKLEAVHGKKIQAVYAEDPSLIGGIKIALDDKVLDGSIEKRLQKVKEVINS